MAEVITVSSADVRRARLVVTLNEDAGKPTSESIRKIAAAKPLNGHGKPPAS